MTTKNMLSTDVETLSKQTSITLMKNMIRISISSICYMRGLFDESCFKKIKYGGLEIRQLDVASIDEKNHTILANNEEAFRLTQWLERGVFDALQKEYLDSLKFAIFSKHPITGLDTILETYDFSLQYSSADQATSASINGISILTKESVRQQAKKFIRSLLEFTNTLDDLPSNRWLTIMLKYRSDAPKEYEPDLFKSSDGQIGTFDGKPIRLAVGNVSSNYLNINVMFEGLENLTKLNDNGEDDAAITAAADMKSTDIVDARLPTPVKLFRGESHAINKPSLILLDLPIGRPIPVADIPADEDVGVDAKEVIEVDGEREENALCEAGTVANDHYSSLLPQSPRQSQNDDSYNNDDSICGYDTLPETLADITITAKQIPDTTAIYDQIKNYMIQSNTAPSKVQCFSLTDDVPGMSKSDKRKQIGIVYDQLLQENFIYKNHRGKPFLKHNYVTAHTPSAVAAADTSDATIAALASPAIDARQYKDEDSYDDTAVKSLTAIKAVSKKIDAAAVAATAATVPTVAVAATTVTVAVAGVKKRKYGIIQQPILLDRVKKSTSSKSNAMSTSEKKYTSSSSKQTKASHNSYQKKASHM